VIVDKELKVTICLHDYVYSDLSVRKGYNNYVSSKEDGLHCYIKQPSARAQIHIRKETPHFNSIQNIFFSIKMQGG